MQLFDEQCHRPDPGQRPLDPDQAHELIKEVPGWTLKADSIERIFEFEDFDDAMHFVNHVAHTAGAQDHHPDIHISYNKVRLVFSTHKVKGLSRNDFIMAAKCNQLTCHVTV
ncbi:MAG: 4a-hydroxytetrahydrobiopterin dehydratase [Planctomycetaceae bacterium]|nr:4a-hydroxytetrahydrobiopterin dehydratase [Planctomycetaceae bacterium]